MQGWSLWSRSISCTLMPLSARSGTCPGNATFGPLPGTSGSAGRADTAGPWSMTDDVVVPARGAAYPLSYALAATALASASLSFFVPGVLAGPAVSQGTLRGTALVVMGVAVPVLIVSVLRAARGSARALVFWYAAVAYLLYQGVLFVFGTPFNALFLLYVAMLSLAIWSLVTLVHATDEPAFVRRFTPDLPAHALAVYAATLAVLNALAWLRTILPATLADEPASFLDGSGMTTNPVFVQDLAFWLPLLLVGAWWLWSLRPWGEVVVGTMLVMLVLEGVGVATDQWFGVRADPDTAFASAGAVPLFLTLAAIGCMPVWFYLRHLDPRSTRPGLSTDRARAATPGAPPRPSSRS